MLSPDIDENVLAALQIIFLNDLQTAINTAGGYLPLKVLKQADLQDDPTISAPYLVYRPDIDKGIIPIPKDMEHMYGSSEIGGPFKYLHHFDAKYGSPIRSTRNQARTDIAIIQTRVMQTLMNHCDLSNVLTPTSGSLGAPDQSKYIEGANPYLIDKITTRIIGGETTFFGEGHIYWHYPVSWYESFQVFIPGA